MIWRISRKEKQKPNKKKYIFMAVNNRHFLELQHLSCSTPTQDFFEMTFWRKYPSPIFFVFVFYIIISLWCSDKKKNYNSNNNA